MFGIHIISVPLRPICSLTTPTIIKQTKNIIHFMIQYYANIRTNGISFPEDIIRFRGKAMPCGAHQLPHHTT